MHIHCKYHYHSNDGTETDHSKWDAIKGNYIVMETEANASKIVNYYD